MTKKILCIDDSINLLQVLKKRFEIELDDVEVFTASNGLDGLKAAANNLPDLIFLDINLPDLNGDKVLEKIKGNQNLKDIPVIILTARGYEEKDNYISLGAIAYFCSPFDTLELVEKARSILFPTK